MGPPTNGTSGGQVMSDAKQDSEAPVSENGFVERRTDVRHCAHLPSQIERADGSSRMAMVADISVSGALILTRAKLDPGEAIQLSLHTYVGDHEDTHQVAARVVRADRLPADLAHLWAYTAAIQFDVQLTHLKSAIEEIARAQKRLLGSRACAP